MDSISEKSTGNKRAMNQEYFSATFAGEPVDLPKVPPFVFDGVSGALRDALWLGFAIQATAEQIQTDRGHGKHEA